MRGDRSGGIGRGGCCIKLRLILSLFVRALAYTLAQAKDFVFWLFINSYYCSCSGIGSLFICLSCIGLGPLLGSGSGSGSYFSLSVMHRPMLLFILRFKLKPEQGHEHRHKLGLDMTKKQNMII